MILTVLHRNQGEDHTTTLVRNTENEKVFLTEVFEQMNETLERNGGNAAYFLFRGTIEGVNADSARKPINDRWW